MPSSPAGGLHAHRLRDRRAPIAALGHEPVVAKTLHQHRPGPCDADGIPPGGCRLGGESVARQRRNHEMEGVRRAPAVRGGVGQRLDDLQLLDDRAGPPVRDDQRQRVLVLRANVNEVDVEPIDLGDEVRQGVQLRLALAPVVVGRPVARELLHHREPHALRVVADRLALGPPGRVDAPPQVGELLLRKTDLKRPDSGWPSVGPATWEADICSSYGCVGYRAIVAAGTAVRQPGRTVRMLMCGDARRAPDKSRTR